MRCTGGAHIFLPTRDHDVGITAQNRLCGKMRGFQSATAHFIDRHGRHHIRDAGFDGGLATRDLTLTGHQHLTHDHVFDFVGCYASSLQRGTDGEAPQVGGGERRECAAHLSDRCAGSCDDVRPGHDAPFC